MCITKNLPLVQHQVHKYQPSKHHIHSSQGSSKQADIWSPEVNVGMEGKLVIELRKDAMFQLLGMG